MITDSQAAAWLQEKLDRDEGAFKVRPGAASALERLRTVSAAVAYRLKGDRVELLVGRKIGGRALSAARDARAVHDFADRFYREYGALFSASVFPENSLRVESTRSVATTVAKLQQYVDGIPVVDARWTMIFDVTGFLTHVTGAPFDPAGISVDTRPHLDGDRAIVLVLEHLSQLLGKGALVAPQDVETSASLAIEGRNNRLVWMIDLKSAKQPSLFSGFSVDAHRGTVVAHDDCCEHGLVVIPVTHYSHSGGVKDSSGSTTTTEINVDTIEVPGVGDVYALQRLGSGRCRIWNAKPVGTDATPIFSRAISFLEDYFTKEPGTTDDNIFNEQQTYYWAQSLKTHVDEWGRQPNDYGHYSVDTNRDVNVEVVVNGDASMEDDWSADGKAGAMHGYFRSETPRSWFLNHPGTASEVPAVFLFNSAGNSASPQFFGPEYSSSYSIVAHEAGHFISWQYGRWSGASGTELAGSLNEGHSMVLAALFGKQRFPDLSYTDSAFVTTGSRTGPSDAQWSHFVYGTPALTYSSMDCISDNRYYIAWPFVQAMWRLMNNMDAAGDRIWNTDEAAITNTADLFMYSLYYFTDDSTMTWDKLCICLLARIYERIDNGLEKEPLPEYGSYCGVFSVFQEHGLLSECVNSP